MKTKTIHLVLGLSLAVLPLAGCDRDNVESVEASRDAEGKVQVHVDGSEVQRELDQAGEQIQAGAQRVQEGAEQVGAALERGVEQAEAKVGPVVEDLLDDASITARVKARLIADPEVKSFQIDVDSLDGRVTLNGRVASAEQRDEAEKLAARTEGVREVINLIQVAGQAPPTPPQGSGR